MNTRRLLRHVHIVAMVAIFVQAFLPVITAAPQAAAAPAPATSSTPTFATPGGSLSSTTRTPSNPTITIGEASIAPTELTVSIDTPITVINDSNRERRVRISSRRPDGENADDTDDGKDGDDVDAPVVEGTPTAEIPTTTTATTTPATTTPTTTTTTPVAAPTTTTPTTTTTTPVAAPTPTATPTPQTPAPSQANYAIYMPLIMMQGATTHAATAAVDDTMTVGSGQIATYTFPAPGTYYVSDADHPALVATIEVVPRPNRAPRTYHMSVVIEHNQPVTLEPGSLAAIDPDEDALHLSVAQPPTAGSASITGPSLTYTPQQDYTGLDSLAVKLTDDAGNSAVATIEITVRPPNRAPLANDRTLTFDSAADTAVLDISPLGYDYEGDDLTYQVEEVSVSTPKVHTDTATIVSDANYTTTYLPEHGTFTFDGASMLGYAPTVPLTTSDLVVYSVRDPHERDAAIMGQVMMVDLSDEEEAQRVVADHSTLKLYADSPAASLDLNTLAFNLDGSDITFALSTTAVLSGEIRLDGSTFAYTPTAAVESAPWNEYIEYVATDTNTGKEAVGTINVIVYPTESYRRRPVIHTERPVWLAVEPRTALFTEVGQQRTLTLHAYNSRGEQVAIPADLAAGIQWNAETQDAAGGLSYTVDLNDPTRVHVTAKATTGHLQLRASWLGMDSASSVMIAAELQPGVVVVPDSAIVGPVNPAPADKQGMGEIDSWDKLGEWMSNHQIRFTTVIDSSQPGAALSAGTLITSDGDTPVAGRIVSATSVATGTEIIYETVPMTNVIASASFNAVYTNRDIIGGGVFAPEVIQGGSQSTAHALQSQGLADATGVSGLASIDPVQASLAANRPLNTRLGGSLGDRYEDEIIYEFELAYRGEEKDQWKAEGRVTGQLTINIYAEFRINVSVDISWHGISADFSFRGGAGATAELQASLEGSATIYGPKFELKAFNKACVFPIPAFPLVGVKCGLSAKPVASLSGKASLEASKSVSVNGRFHLKTWELPSASAESEGFDPSMDISVTIHKIKAYATIENTLKVSIGVVGVDEDMAEELAQEIERLNKEHGGLAQFITDVEPAIEFKLMLPLFTFEYEEDKAIPRPHYGYGYFGLGAGFSVGVGGGIAKAAKKLKFWTGIDIQFLTKPLVEGRIVAGYPSGRGSPAPPEGYCEEGDEGCEEEECPDGEECADDEPTVPEDVCAQDGPQSYEDDYVRVTCKQEPKECPSDQDGQIIEYLRKTEYKGEDARRHYTFATVFDRIPLLRDLRNVLLRYIEDVEVYVVYQNTPTGSGGACVAQDVFYKVGTVEKVKADYWKWEWSDFPEGTHKLVAFSNPTLIDMHFHISGWAGLMGQVKYWFGTGSLRGKDEFTVSRGNCAEENWQLVDSENQCKSRPPKEFTPRSLPLPGPRPPHREPRACWNCRVYFRGGDGPSPNEAESLDELPIAKSWGDPHVTMFDGSSYTMLHLGEFVYLRDWKDPSIFGLEVQVRQERLPGYPDWASFNTAAAIRAGGNIFEVRLPDTPTLSDDLELLINGESADLLPGYYTVGDALLRVDTGNRMTLWVRDPDVTTPETYSGNGLTRVRVGLLSEKIVGASSEPATSLDVGISNAPTGHYHGLLGNSDGVRGNDYRDPHGNPVGGLDEFYEAWRITDPLDSLFTYEDGEGPHTFNLVQDASFPTRDELEGSGGGRNYMQEAIDLLQDRCSSNIDAISPDFIEDIALELALGRSANNMVASGLCLDEHVYRAGEPFYPLVGFDFNGRVSLADFPDLTASGARVTIRVDELGDKKLCDTTTYSDGSFSCGLTSYSDPYRELTTMTLTYRVTGRGAPVERSVVVPAPRPGQWLEDYQNIQVAPNNVLHLTGRLLGPDSVPLANGHVRVTSPSFVEDRADSNGDYSMYLVLPDGIESGELHYEAASANFGSYGTLVHPFDLFTHGMHEIELDIVTEPMPAPPEYPAHSRQADAESTARTLIFSGKVQNQHIMTDDPAAPNGVPGARVTITSDGIEGGVCETTTNDSGKYSCPATVIVTDTFTADIAVERVGSATTIATVSEDEIPAPGGSLAKVTDITVSPTTFKLIGSAEDPDNDPLEGAAVVVTSPATGEGFSTSATTATAPDGQYQTYLAVPNMHMLGDPDHVAGLLSYRVSYETGAGKSLMVKQMNLAELVGGPPEVGKLTTIAKSFTFDGRTIAFSGRVRNALVSDFWVPRARVTITSPALGILCETTADAQGYYGCDGYLEGGDPISVTYQISNRGTYSETVMVDPSEAGVGGRYPFSKSFSINATTLEISGTVRDEYGEPVGGATVGVATGTDGRNTTTGSDGRYTLYVVLDNGITVGDLWFNVSYSSRTGSASATDSTGYIVTAGQLATIAHDLDIELGDAGLDQDKASRFKIHGTVYNANSGEPLPVASVVVRGTGEDASLGTLCTATTGGNGSYTCSGTLVNENPLDVEFEVSFSGTHLGTFPASYTLAPGTAFLNEYVKEMTVSPTTIRVHGHITDRDDRPLGGASYTMLSPAYARTAADDQGDYEVYVPIPGDVLSGTISYHVSYRDISVSRQQSYAHLDEGRLNHLAAIHTRLPFTARFAVLQGRVTNDLAPQAKSGIRVDISSAELGGSLCHAETDAQGDYSCRVALDSSDPFTVTYVVAGESLDGGGQPHTLVLGVAPNLLPPAGGERFYNKDFTVSPTTVYLTGIISDTEGQPVQGARVGVGGLFSASATTGPDGRYHIYHVVPETTAEGTLTVAASKDGDTAAGALPVELAPKALNEAHYHLALQSPPDDPGDPDLSRTVYLVGHVQTHIAGSLVLPVDGAQVTVDAPASDASCQATTSGNGSYSCSIVVMTDTIPLDIEMAVSKRGYATFHTQITDIPEAGGVGTFVKDFTVEPTTLRLFGRVVDGNENSLANAHVTISGAASANMHTGSQGRYDEYRFVDNSFAQGTLGYQASYGSENYSLTRPISVAAGLLHPIEQDLAISGRTLIFKGQVLSSLQTGMVVPWATVEVVWPGHGTLCQTTSQANGFYQCSARVTTANPFPLSYRVSGSWGTTEIESYVSSLPPVGSSTDYPLALEVPAAGGRFVTMSGHVINELEPSLGLEHAHITLSSVSMDTWCTTTTDASGNYTCPEQAVGGGALAFTALVTGTWGTATRNYTIPEDDLPPPEQHSTVTHDMLVPATTLHISGTVTDGSAPIADAAVEVSSSFFAGTLDTQTDEHGHYALTTLADLSGGTGGTVDVVATKNGLSASQQTPTTVVPNAVTTVETSLEIDKRRVSFSGHLSNTLVGGYLDGMQSTVTILADGHEVCSVITAPDDGAYACGPVITTTAALDVVYEVSGDWGSATLNAQVPAGPGASSTTFEHDLGIAPTTLRLRGHIYDFEGNPSPYHTLTIRNADEPSPIVSGQADDIGLYDLYMVLDEGETSINLEYETNGTTDTRSHSGLAPNQLTTLSYDIREQRLVTVEVAGDFYNELLPPGTEVEGYWIADTATEVRVISGTQELCTATIDETPAAAFPFACETDILFTSAVPLDVDLAVGGTWGAVTSTLTVDPTAASYDGDDYTLSLADQSIPVNPTTLRFVGTVVDIDGQAIGSQEIGLTEADDSEFSRSYDLDYGVTETATDGSYEIYAILGSNATDGSVRYYLDGAYYGGSTDLHFPNRTFSGLTPNALNDVMRDFGERRMLNVRVNGSLFNELLPDGIAIGNDWLEGTGLVLKNGPNTVCDTEEGIAAGESSFECASIWSNQIISTDPFSVTYEVEGDWGSTTIDRSIFPLGSVPRGPTYPPYTSCSIYHGCDIVTAYLLEVDGEALGVQPTTLHITGTTRDSSDDPVPGAELEVSGYGSDVSLSDEGSGAGSYSSSSEDGSYSFYAILHDASDEASLRYEMTIGGGDAEAFFPTFSGLTAGAINDRTYDPHAAPLPLEFTIETVAGSGSSGFSGDGGDALLAAINPNDIEVMDNGTIYIADGSNQRIRRVNPDGTIETAVHFSGLHITGLAIDPTETYAYQGAWEDTASARVRRATISTGAYATYVSNVHLPTRLAVDRVNNLLYISEMNGHKITRIDLSDGSETLCASAGSSRVSGVAVGPDGSVYYFEMDDKKLMKVSGGTSGCGTPEVVAGTGVECVSSTAACGDGGLATNATFKFSHGHGVAVGPDGAVYVSEPERNRIRRIDPDTGIIETIAGDGSAGFGGDGGPASQARLNGPGGLFVRSDNVLYVADGGNRRVRALTPNQ